MQRESRPKNILLQAYSKPTNVLYDDTNLVWATDIQQVEPFGLAIFSLDIDNIYSVTKNRVQYLVLRRWISVGNSPDKVLTVVTRLVDNL